jgi:hypothetical protein
MHLHMACASTIQGKSASDYQGGLTCWMEYDGGTRPPPYGSPFRGEFRHLLREGLSYTNIK